MKKKISFITSGLVLAILIGVLIFTIVNTPHFSVEVNKQGLLYIKHNLKETEDFIVVWETDAGSFTENNKYDNYISQSDTGYYLYTPVDAAVEWSSEDFDEYEYDIATIKATIVSYHSTADYITPRDSLGTKEITVRKDIVIMETEKRVFGNPHRKDGNFDWQQIMILQAQEDYLTLRYRTGSLLDKNDVICWKTDIVSHMSEASSFLIPIYVPNSNTYDDSLILTDTICFEISPSAFYNEGGSTLKDYTGYINAFVMKEKDAKKTELDMSLARNIAEFDIVVDNYEFVLR